MLDLKKFKKVGADKTHTTFEHPDGHIIKVSHKAISDQMRKSMKGIPEKKSKMPQGYADGGEVDQPQSSYQDDRFNPSPPISPEPTPFTGYNSVGEELTAANDGNSALNNSHISPIANTPFNIVPPPAEERAPAEAAPTQPMGEEQEMRNGYGLMQQGLYDEAQAVGRQGRAESSALQLAAKQQQEQQQRFEEKYQQLNEQRAHFVQDLQDGHIEPNHYWSNLGTAGKVGTVVGLILGGLGAGPNGENQAINFFKDQINRDVKAQEFEMEKKNNLLKYNQQEFGNLHDATNMTRVMMADAIDLQLRKAAANAKDPMAQARLLQAAGQLQTHYAPLFQEAARKQALQHSIAAGTTSAYDQAAQQIALLPEKQQDKAAESLGKIKELDGLNQEYLKSFQDIQSKFLNGTFSPSDRDSAVNILAGKLSHATAGRYNENEAHKLMESMLPSKTDISKETIDNKMKRGQSLFGAMRAEHEPALAIRGIRIAQPQNTVIKMMGGKPYQQVPGGWMPVKGKR